MTTSSKELLHKLNNQLGVILAHAELLETKAQDASQKARASQVVNAALQAMAVSRELRETVGDESNPSLTNPSSTSRSARFEVLPHPRSIRRMRNSPSITDL